MFEWETQEEFDEKLVVERFKQGIEKLLEKLVEPEKLKEEEKKIEELAEGISREISQRLKKLYPTREELRKAKEYQKVVEEYLKKIADGVKEDIPYLKVEGVLSHYLLLSVGSPDYEFARSSGIYRFRLFATRVIYKIKEDKMSVHLFDAGYVEVKDGKIISKPTKQEILLEIGKSAIDKCVMRSLMK